MMHTAQGLVHYNQSVALRQLKGVSKLLTKNKCQSAFLRFASATKGILQITWT